MASWTKFVQLTPEARAQIAQELIAKIEDDLQASLEVALDESIPRKVASVTFRVRTTHGETHDFTFNNLKEALAFIEKFDEARDLDTSAAPNLIDNVHSSPLEPEEEEFLVGAEE